MVNGLQAQTNGMFPMMNNQFQSIYSSMQQPYMNTISQANNVSNSMIWVQGIEGAKAYQMPINGISVLFDSETEGRFYIKTSDNIGMCNLRVFDYTEITNSANMQQSGANVDMTKYVTKDELNSILAAFGGMNNEQSVSANESASNDTNAKHK